MLDPDSYRTYAYYEDSANPYQVTRTVAKDGKMTNFGYDQYGNLTSVINPRTVTTTFTYDYTAFPLGRLVETREGTLTPTTLTYYEPSGLPESVTHAQPGATNGSTVSTMFTYDALGNITSITAPGNDATPMMTTSFNYTTDGAYTQPAAIGQPLTVTNNLGQIARYRYDARGNCLYVQDAQGHATTMTYNLVGQPLITTLPATGQSGTGQGCVELVYLYPGGPVTEQRVYDEGNTPTPVRTVQFTYGNFGEVLQRTGSDETVAYQYDGRNRVTVLRDGNNNATTYTYDLTGHLTQIQYPGGETVRFTAFDPAGRILTRVDGNDVVTNYTYNDPEGLLTNIAYPATPALNVSFSYDSYGRRSQMTDGTGVHTYTYDHLDTPLTVTTQYTGLPARTLSYQYHPDGSRAQMTTPVGLHLLLRCRRTADKPAQSLRTAGRLAVFEQ